MTAPRKPRPPARSNDDAQSAPGVAEIRVSGEAADTDAITAAIEAAGVEVLTRSAPYPNRRSPGQRVYLTVRVRQTSPEENA